jgi:hypothetical protein
MFLRTAFGWVSLFTDVATEMVYPLLPVFLQSIGAGAQALGLMEGIEVTVDPARHTVEESKDATPALPGKLRAYLALVALFTLGASADSLLMLRMSDLGLATAWLPIAWISLNASKALLNIRRRQGQLAFWASSECACAAAIGLAVFVPAASARK